MGYTTTFEGRFHIAPPLKTWHVAYLQTFAYTRRMKRDAKIANTLADPIRLAAELNIGPDGAYYVGGASDGNFGQTQDVSVIAHDTPPEAQPSLWCQWVPSMDGAWMQWDGGEKFDQYDRWLQYMIDHFLAPWGYVLNGSVTWRGEDPSDLGRLVVMHNELDVQRGYVMYESKKEDT